MLITISLIMQLMTTKTLIYLSNLYFYQFLVVFYYYVLLVHLYGQFLIVWWLINDNWEISIPNSFC